MRGAVANACTHHQQLSRMYNVCDFPLPCPPPSCLSRLDMQKIIFLKIFSEKQRCRLERIKYILVSKLVVLVVSKNIINNKHIISIQWIRRAQAPWRECVKHLRVIFSPLIISFLAPGHFVRELRQTTSSTQRQPYNGDTASAQWIMMGTPSYKSQPGGRCTLRASPRMMSSSFGIVQYRNKSIG